MIKLIDSLIEKQPHYISYLRKLCKGSTDDAEDVFQTLCVKVISSGKELPTEEEAEKYLYTSARNCFVRWKQQQQPSIRLDLQENSDEERHPDQVGLTFAQLHSDNMDDTVNPLDKVLEEEKQNTIPEMISEIKHETHRKLLRMVYMEDVTQVVAADLVGISQTNARGICYRFLNSFN